MDCGTSYHVEYKKTAQSGMCDKCGGEVTLRKDDAPETVSERLNVYHEQTEPLKAYYEKSGKLYLVQGQEEIDDTTRLTFEALN